MLAQLKGFRFMKTLFLMLKRVDSQDKTKYDNFYLNSKAETIFNDSDINEVFESIYTTIISNIH